MTRYPNQRLEHRCFDNSDAILQATVTNDLPDLEVAIAHLRLCRTQEGQGTTPRVPADEDRSTGLEAGVVTRGTEHG